MSATAGAFGGPSLAQPLAGALQGLRPPPQPEEVDPEEQHPPV